MLRSLAWSIGLRYTKAKQRHRFVSFIALISMLAIAVGITALICIISIMNGFQNELRTRILGSTEHMKLTGPDGVLKDWQKWHKTLQAVKEIEASAPYIQAEVMITHGENVYGTMVRGVKPNIENKISEIEEKMVIGDLAQLDQERFQIILGADLAQRLSVNVGNKVTLVSPFTMVTPAGLLPRVKKFTVVGIFKIDMYNFDNRFALIGIDDAAKFFRLSDSVTGLRIKTNDIFAAPAIADELNKKYPQLKFSDWTKENVAFFQALKVEKVVMMIILTLIILVAVVNIVSMLVMMVTDKRADIAILRTVGASRRSMIGIFVIQGSIVGAIGTLIGLIGGVLLAENIETLVPLIEGILGQKIFPDDIYYISEIPSEILWTDVFIIGMISLGLTVLATLYPAWQAAKTQPAEVLRYDW